MYSEFINFTPGSCKYHLLPTVPTLEQAVTIFALHAPPMTSPGQCTLPPYSYHNEAPDMMSSQGFVITTRIKVSKLTSVKFTMDLYRLQMQVPAV